VLVGRRAALTRDFAGMLDDLRDLLGRLDRQQSDPEPGRDPRPDAGGRSPRRRADRNTAPRRDARAE
jgi:hypothetical protein